MERIFHKEINGRENPRLLGDRAHIIFILWTFLVADIAHLILAFDSFPSELYGCFRILAVKFLRTFYFSCILQIVLYRTIA